jgi:hypothetical protein
MAAGVVGGCVALAALSLLLVPFALAFDAEAWTIWGRETARLALDTSSVPSWKPLPVLFTAPLALLGLPVQLGWLLVARAGGLLAVLGAAVLARRVGGVPAALTAGALLALSPWWLLNTALANSEGILAAAVLWAVIAHLAGRHGLALASALLASLVRPEAWPFLGLYALWLWRAHPSLRARAALALALVPALWIVPDFLSSGEFLRSSHLARGMPSPGSAGLDPVPALSVLGDFASLVGFAVLAAALAASALAVRHRERVVTWLVAGTAGWVGIVAAMAQGGYPGRPRYLAPAAALVCVLAGAGTARLAELAARGRARARSGPVAWALGGLFVAYAGASWSGELAGSVREIEHRAQLRAGLTELVESAGGPAAVRACGAVSAPGPLRTRVAWELDLPIIAVAPEAQTPGAVVRLRVRDGRVLPALTPRQRAALSPVVRNAPWELLSTCAPDPPRLPPA